MGRTADNSHGQHCPECRTLGYHAGSKRGVKSFRCRDPKCGRVFNSKTAYRAAKDSAPYATAERITHGRGSAWGFDLFYS